MCFIFQLGVFEPLFEEAKSTKAPVAGLPPFKAEEDSAPVMHPSSGVPVAGDVMLLFSPSTYLRYSSQTWLSFSTKV